MSLYTCIHTSVIIELPSARALRMLQSLVSCELLGISLRHLESRQNVLRNDTPSVSINGYTVDMGSSRDYSQRVGFDLALDMNAALLDSTAATFHLICLSTFTLFRGTSGGGESRVRETMVWVSNPPVLIFIDFTSF